MLLKQEWINKDAIIFLTNSLSGPLVFLLFVRHVVALLPKDRANFDDSKNLLIFCLVIIASRVLNWNVLSIVWY